MYLFNNRKLRMSEKSENFQTSSSSSSNSCSDSSSNSCSDSSSGSYSDSDSSIGNTQTNSSDT